MRLFATAVKFVLLGAAIALFILGCTVTPHQVTSRTASMDGTNRNSGFIGFRADGYGMFTEHAKQRYDSLVRRYGNRFQVPVHEGDGLWQTNGSPIWLLDPEHCTDFETMTRWSNSE